MPDPDPIEEVLAEFQSLRPPRIGARKLKLIERMIALCGGNKTQAARALGIHRTTYHTICKRLGLKKRKIPASKPNPEEREEILAEFQSLRPPQLAERKKELMFRMIELCGNNKAQAARTLGISRDYLFGMIQKK